MQWPQLSWPRITWRGAAIGMIITAVALASIMAGAIVSISNGPGRWLARSFIDGREIDGLGLVRIEGVNGNLLSDFSIDRITITDQNGVWLEAEQIGVHWQPLSLSDGPIRIDRLSVDRIAVARRPDLPESSQSRTQGTGSLPGIILSDGQISRIELADAVLGEAVVLEARAALDLPSLHAGNLALQINRLDAPGDAVELRLDIQADGRVDGQFTATGAPGGPLTRLAQIPDEAIALTADLGGTRDAGDGRFDLMLSGREMAGGEIAWQGDAWRLDGAVQPGNWTGLPEILAPILARGEVQLHGSLNGRSVERVHLQAETLSADLARTDGTAWTAALEVREAALSQLTQGQATAELAAFEGQLDFTSGIALDGVLNATELTLAETGFASVSGPLQMRYLDGALQLDTQLAITAPELPDARMNAVLGSEIALDLALTANPAAGRYDVTHATLTGAHLNLTAQGVYAPAEDIRQFNANIELDDISRLTDQARGPVTATISSASNNRFDIALDGSALQTDTALAPFLDGLRIAASAVVADGQWQLDGLTLRTSSIAAEARADGTMEGDWHVAGDLAVSGALAGTSLEFAGGLATGFDVSSQAGQFTAQTVTATEAVALGGSRIEAPRLAVTARTVDGALMADWSLAGSILEQELSLAGSVEQTATGWTAAIGDSHLGPAAITATGEISNGQLAFDFATGSLDRWSLTVNYAAGLDALLEGDLDARLAVRDLIAGSLVLEDAAVSLTGAPEALALDARLAGVMGVPFDLAATGTIGAADGLQAEITASGHIGENEWRTLEPITATLDGDGRSLATRLAFGGGELGGHWQQSDESGQLEFRIDDLPVGVLVDLAGLPAVDGVLNGTASLDQTDGVWRGDASVSASQLSAVTLSDAPELEITTQISLGENARIETLATGGGLSARALLTRMGPTIALRSILDGPEGVIEGSLVVTGEIESLTSLVMPIGTSFSGDSDINLTIAGTRQTPQIDGSIALHDGRLTATETGTDIVNLQLASHVHNSEIELESFSADDGLSGSMTATATGTLTAAGPRGTAEINFISFTAVRRPDLTARMSGQTVLTMADDGLLVSGETRLERVTAQPPASSPAAIPEIEVSEFNLPKNQIRAARARLPIRLDYRVYATDQIYFSSTNFNTEWRADVAITGRSNKLTLTGTADVLNGSGIVFNRRFLLEDGQVVFNGPARNARITLSAVHQRQDFLARVTASGSLMAPTITLSSDPTLPQDEIIARLLFDRPASELGPFEAAQLAAQLSGGDFLGVVGRLRQLTGVDRLDISSDADGALTVISGRRFGDDFYVEVESGGASALSAARVEWSLTPDLSILSRLSADTNASVSIRWRREY
tara:strand:- start:43273 stop:47346 length:4074 start_codon:yes stop_codon:yes gene_type:complete